MSLTEKEIRKIAHLSRIKIEDSEIEHFQKELSGIIDWVEMLQEVDTSGVEGTASIADLKLPQRVDEISDGNIRDEVLQNAPNSQYGFFAVPKVVE